MSSSLEDIKAPFASACLFVRIVKKWNIRKESLNITMPGKEQFWAEDDGKHHSGNMNVVSNSGKKLLEEMERQLWEEQI